ncbi:adenylyl-sulfate kinase [Pseudomonas sp. sp1636]|uniref:adenylyl-sulfate kinase n=1 Tax=Pseudomonas sp. sp1636 TaxID=3036707 RepID=UPI0025A5467A|nr:adenylyl-sulfate kinase [Pseudomonas sp. sp1636]MDM8351106.1 adenylyl-sulfate kinase [Pseudomonas sp. sp1636]
MDSPAQTPVSRAQRELRNGHGAAVLLLTGLSGAGKSTLAQALARRLFELGAHSYVLDGDELRSGLNADLGFTAGARRENLRRSAETARLLADSGALVIAALIAPLAESRGYWRERVGAPFFEVWCCASLQVCEARDAKGLYARARAGELADFTGISAPYEAPLQADLVIDSGRCNVEESVELLLRMLRRHALLAPEENLGTNDHASG